MENQKKYIRSNNTVCLFVCLFVCIVQISHCDPCPRFSKSSYNMGRVLNTIRLTQPLFATRMHMSCVRIENTVLYLWPALICPLEFNRAINTPCF